MYAKEQKGEDNDDYLQKFTLLYEMLRQHGRGVGGHDLFFSYEENVGNLGPAAPKKPMKPRKPKVDEAEGVTKRYELDLELYPSQSKEYEEYAKDLKERAEQKALAMLFITNADKVRYQGLEERLREA